MIRKTTSKSRRTGKSAAVAVSTMPHKPAARVSPGQAKFNSWLDSHSCRMAKPLKEKLFQLGTTLWLTPGKNLSVANLVKETGLSEDTVSRLLDGLHKSKLVDKVNGHVFVSEYFVTDKLKMQRAKSKLLAAEAKKAPKAKTRRPKSVAVDKVFEKFRLHDSALIQRLLASAKNVKGAKARVARNVMMFVDAGLQPIIIDCIELSQPRIRAKIKKIKDENLTRAAQITELKEMGVWRFRHIGEAILRREQGPGQILRNAKLFVKAGLPIRAALLRYSKEKINAFIRERVAENKRRGIPLVPNVDAVFEKHQLMDNPKIKAAVKANSSKWLIASKALLFEQAGLEPKPGFILQETHQKIAKHIAKKIARNKAG